MLMAESTLRKVGLGQFTVYVILLSPLANMCIRDRNVYKLYLCGWYQSLLQIPEKVTPDSESHRASALCV